MALKFLLFILPAVTLAKIQFTISGPSKNLSLTFSGKESGVITDLDRESFQLSDSNLKKGAVPLIDNFGQRPDYVYVKSPVPFGDDLTGDAFQYYGWKEVRTTLVPMRGRILSMTTIPPFVVRRVLENPSPITVTFNTSFPEPKNNTITSSWMKPVDLTIGREVRCNLDIYHPNEGLTLLSFVLPWGVDFEKIQTVNDTEHKVSVMVKPGESVIAELKAKRASMKVEVEYEAKLSGDVIIALENWTKFWNRKVDEVMSKAGLTNSLIFKQIIDITFFTTGGSQLTLLDTSDAK